MAVVSFSRLVEKPRLECPDGARACARVWGKGKKHTPNRAEKLKRVSRQDKVKPMKIKWSDGMKE